MIERIFYTKNDAIQEYSIPAKDKLPKKIQIFRKVQIAEFSQRSFGKNSDSEIPEE